MPELPGPPEKYDDAQRRAWFDGAATVAELFSDQMTIVAKQYDEAAGDLAADDAGDEDGVCPACGANLVESFGTAVCADCTYEE